MNKTNVYELPLAFNICDQLLREIDQSPMWSMAHVLMNPKTWSLPHEHQRMDEAYIITRGTGHLVRDNNIFIVQAGDVLWIPRSTRHKLTNTSAASLEHLVLAVPPFNPADVSVDESRQDPKAVPQQFVQPPVNDCFDGAKIIAYEFGNIVSIAFGWVAADPARRKPAHYHEKTTEWIYVIEGEGAIEINDLLYPIVCGDWIRVSPGEEHALRNDKNQHMVVVCVSTPCFTADDVHYR